MSDEQLDEKLERNAYECSGCGKEFDSAVKRAWHEARNECGKVPEEIRRVRDSGYF